MAERPDAAALSRTAPPDILLGSLGLWVAGPTGNDGWLDLAVRVGDDYQTIAETNGPLIRLNELIAFEPALRALAEAETGEVLLWSEGGALTVRVKRYARHSGNYVEVGLRRSIYDQKISFSVAPGAYASALVGLRGVLTRLEAELQANRPALPELDPEPAWTVAARQRSGAPLASDFPAEALAQRRVGVTEVEYLVSTDGAPRDIRVTGPSGDDTLDAATLSVISDRFRYDPATDASGSPVAQIQRRKVAWLTRWEAPDVLDAAEVTFRYVVDGVGWFSVEVQVGAASGGFGGSWMTAAMEDLLRIGAALAGGVRRAEMVVDAEPFLTRIEFEVETLNSSVPARDNRWTATDGCWIRIGDIDHRTQERKEFEFEALCLSPLAVAEAIHRMALPHFAQQARTDFPAFAALVAAIRAARGDAGGPQG